MAADEADLRLATYGTLGPGRPNHGQLRDLPGRWLTGQVRGALVEEGWGAGLGFPGLVLDAAGPVVEVDVFESKALPQHWHRLDAFEGPGYRRVAVDVSTREGPLRASIYVLARDATLAGHEQRRSIPREGASYRTPWTAKKEAPPWRGLWSG